jgi:hypothetical protein
MAIELSTFHPRHITRRTPKVFDSDLRKALLVAALILAMFFLWSMRKPDRAIEEPAPKPAPTASALT